MFDVISTLKIVFLVLNRFFGHYCVSAVSRVWSHSDFQLLRHFAELFMYHHLDLSSLLSPVSSLLSPLSSLLSPLSCLLSPLSRYWLRLHCDRVPAEYLLHRHPGLGSLLPVPGRFLERKVPSLSFTNDSHFRDASGFSSGQCDFWFLALLSAGWLECQCCRNSRLDQPNEEMIKWKSQLPANSITHSVNSSQFVKKCLDLRTDSTTLEQSLMTNVKAVFYQVNVNLSNVPNTRHTVTWRYVMVFFSGSSKRLEATKIWSKHLSADTVCLTHTWLANSLFATLGVRGPGYRFELAQPSVRERINDSGGRD